MASRPEVAVCGRALTRLHPNGLGVVDVDVFAAGGQIVGITGDNGAGKTTLLRLLATLEPPSDGLLTWWGTANRRRPAVRRRLGVMLDASVHFDQLTGLQNCMFFARRYGLSRSRARSRVEELLKWAGLHEVRHLAVQEYSLGMRRRLSLVEALAHEPDLIVLDEPSLALDYKGELGLESRIQSEASRGAAIVVATNDPRLESICHTVVRLVRGRPVAGSAAA